MHNESGPNEQIRNEGHKKDLSGPEKGERKRSTFVITSQLGELIGPGKTAQS
jgi:hypothetical protein